MLEQCILKKQQQCSPWEGRFFIFVFVVVVVVVVVVVFLQKSSLRASSIDSWMLIYHSQLQDNSETF